MKTINYLIITLFFITFSYCSKDNPTSPGDGGGLGGGTSDVNFNVEIVQDQQGTTYFGIKPSADIKLNTLKITQAQQGIDETITNQNPETVFPKDEFITIEVNQNVLVSGQQWSFVINGSLAQGGQTFNKTVNFTVP